MATDILYVAIIAFATMVCPIVNANEDGIIDNTCYSGNTVGYFQLNFLCGEIITTVIRSGADNETMCVICYVDCQNDGTARVTQYTVRNGEQSEPEFSTLTDKNYGKLERVFDNDPLKIPVNVFIVSYTQHIDNTIKFVCIQCDDTNNRPLSISFLCDYDADFTEELDKVKIYYPYLPFTFLPDTCSEADYFPEC